MIIAREKKKNNIAEYILYMWQIEDIIRACNFDINILNEKIIKQLNVEDYLFEEVYVWYSDLIDKMKKQGITKQGHLDFLNKQVEVLNSFHLSLLSNPKEIKYQEIFNSIPNPVFVLDYDSLEILDCNASVESVYGYGKEKIVHKPFLNLFLKGERERYEYMW